MKHELTLQNIKAYDEICAIAFEGVASGRHYRALYEIQSKKGLSAAAAIRALMENKEFADECVKHVNKPEVYKQCMEEVMEYHHSFAQYIELPTREADFVVDCSTETENSKIYFFIDEGVELDIEGDSFQLARLLVDHFTDTLLYNSGDGWSEYKYDSKIQDSICSKVSDAFRDYLAEKQLLGDTNDKD